MLNSIWVAMVVMAVICGAITGKLEDVARASTDSASAAVTLALGLVGVMTLWLGLMQALQAGGLLRGLARLMRPLMVRLFPDVPADHPAMSLMILNMSSNVLGLGNAATPFGLKAMLELNKLNPRPGTATNAMALFLAINTAGVAVLPTGMIALRASLGSRAPGAIFLPTLVASLTATLVAICSAKLLAPLFGLGAAAAPAAADASGEGIETAAAEAIWAQPVVEPTKRQRRLGYALSALVLGALAYALNREAAQSGLPGIAAWGHALSHALSAWPLVLLIVAFVLFGVCRGVQIYDAVVEGGREGFQVAVRIIPYLVTILVAIGMLRASGGVDLLVQLLEPLSSRLGIPAETLPMALLRPLTGSGAYAIAAETMQAYGPDSRIGNIVGTMMGSTETTFYVLALYFGVAQVKRARHAVLACLLADVAGLLTSVWIWRLLGDPL